MTKKREIITVTMSKRRVLENGTVVHLPVKRNIELAEGMRRCDLDDLDNEELDLLEDIYMHGRRRRRYYNSYNLSIMRKLKSRGFVVSIKMNRG